MKKSLKLYILFVVLIIALTACKQEPKPAPEPAPEKEYKIGDIGPAGGYIFYDCDADNDTGNADGLISTEVGWRYLEAAPADLRVVYSVPKVDADAEGYDAAPAGYFFGYYRKTTAYYGSNLFVNGTDVYDEKDCTGTAIGTGKKNTELLVNAMGYYAYSASSGREKKKDYAAMLCSDLVYNGFDDWFLPSKDELNLMYTNLKKKRQGGFANDNYWSSSEYYEYTFSAWVQDFSTGGHQGSSSRVNSDLVRPVRAFMSADDIPVHEHTYSSAWTTDETYHWHTATCEHADEISGKAEHSFSDWIVTKEATQSETGIKTRTCSVCGYEESEEVPAILLVGDIGPAGGYIFYDCDADNDTGNADGLISTEVGWRYLEAAPSDIKLGSDVFFMWGDDGEYGTQTGIGTGKTNTAIIVSKASKSNNPNAATLCNDYTYGGYDDWFLPSKDELNQMCVNLKENGLGGFASYYEYYWSSSEDYNDVDNAWNQYFIDGSQGSSSRYYTIRVRPVRAF